MAKSKSTDTKAGREKKRVETPASLTRHRMPASLISWYMRVRQDDLERFRQAMEAGDFESIRQLGHQWKGTGTSYGMPEITEFGAKLEACAAQGNKQEIESLIGEARGYLDRVSG